MRPLLGADNFVAVSLKEFTGQFKSDLYSKLLVHVEEMNATRGKAADALKKLGLQKRLQGQKPRVKMQML